MKIVRQIFLEISQKYCFFGVKSGLSILYIKIIFAKNVTYRFSEIWKIYSRTRIINRKNRNYAFYRAFEFVGCASNSSRDISKILFFWVKSGQSILYMKIIFAKNVSNRFIFFRKIYSMTRMIYRKNRIHELYAAFQK